MAFKQFALDEHTTVTIYKRRANRSLRLSIAPTGEVRVTIPIWAPYKSGLDFAKSRRGWIMEQQPARSLLISGQAIGKAHHLRFTADPAPIRRNFWRPTQACKKLPKPPVLGSCAARPSSFYPAV